MWSLRQCYRDQGAKHLIPFECHSKPNWEDLSNWKRRACRPKPRRGNADILSGVDNSTADVAGVVPVYFRFADSLVYASPGDNFLEIAAKAGAEIPSSCCSGSCGSCEVEVIKVAVDGERSPPAVVRACIAAVPRGYVRLEVDHVEDPIWGTDGWDT